MIRTANDIERFDLTWSIEGKRGTMRGEMFELHAGELVNAKATIKGHAKRGDTVTITVI